VHPARHPSAPTTSRSRSGTRSRSRTGDASGWRSPPAGAGTILLEPGHGEHPLMAAHRGMVLLVDDDLPFLLSLSDGLATWPRSSRWSRLLRRRGAPGPRRPADRRPRHRPENAGDRRRRPYRACRVGSLTCRGGDHGGTPARGGGTARAPWPPGRPGQAPRPRQLVEELRRALRNAAGRTRGQPW